MLNCFKKMQLAHLCLRARISSFEIHYLHAKSMQGQVQDAPNSFKSMQGEGFPPNATCLVIASCMCSSLKGAPTLLHAFWQRLLLWWICVPSVHVKCWKSSFMEGCLTFGGYAKNKKTQLSSFEQMQLKVILSEV